MVSDSELESGSVEHEGSLDAYRQMVEARAEAMDGEPFFNGSKDHAAIILENLVQNAENEICILTRCLEPDVYCRATVLDALRGYLETAGARVRILSELPISSDASNAFVNMLREKGRFEARVIPENLVGQIKYRFVATDRKSYRYQPDKSNPWRAIAAFNDGRGGAQLFDAFDSIETQSVQ